MKVNIDIDVHHLARVEGHGNIKVRVADGRLEEATWEVVETPRFFEVMLKGKHYTSAGILTARICGICSIGHCLASVRATEDAFGVTVPPAAATLRLLAKHGETLQSHVLHLFFLAAPDFLGLPSAIPLATSRPDVFHLACRLKKLGNNICDVVAGRTTHPVSIHVGGMARMPERSALDRLRGALVAALPDLDATVELFASLKLPAFSRETEFVSLKGECGYPWIGGRMVSTDGVEHAEREYRLMTHEQAVPDNTSKWCRLSRDSFAVGALARFNNNHRWLHVSALKAAKTLGLAPVCHNPFMNNVAQLVETLHVANESIALIDTLLAVPDHPVLKADVSPRAGIGVGAVEVPRGILYHQYEYDDSGKIIRADCVIPTTQNNKNIHLDLSELVKRFATDGMSDQKLELLCSMLVRAYDPCISCSVH